MKSGILTRNDTLLVRPFDEVEAEGLQLLESSRQAEDQPLGVKSPLPAENSASPRVQDDSVQARLADVARQERKRRHLLNILRRPSPPWNPSDHPELEAEGGAAAWVKKLRREAEQASKRRVRVEE